MKSKIDKLDVDKLVPVTADLSKLTDVVRNEVVRIKNIEDKIPDITNLATNASIKSKIIEVKGEIPSIANLATTAALTSVENKIPNVINRVRKTNYNTKINEIAKKVTDQDHRNKYITTPEVSSRKFCCKIKTRKFSKQK